MGCRRQRAGRSWLDCVAESSSVAGESAARVGGGGDLRRSFSVMARPAIVRASCTRSCGFWGSRPCETRISVSHADRRRKTEPTWWGRGPTLSCRRAGDRNGLERRPRARTCMPDGRRTKILVARPIRAPRRSALVGRSTRGQLVETAAKGAQGAPRRILHGVACTRGVWGFLNDAARRALGGVTFAPRDLKDTHLLETCPASAAQGVSCSRFWRPAPRVRGSGTVDRLRRGASH